MSDSLTDFIETVSGTSHLRVEQDFGDGFVRLQTSEAERRQAAQDIRCTEDIVIELLRNSRDAHASNIFLAVHKEGDTRSIVVVDDGCGIPPSMHGLVFEPRVTSKLDTSHMDSWGMHGRGMALYSISVNASEAEVVDSDSDMGCAIKVLTNLNNLSERTDQSSFPSFELADSGKVNVRGPRNILRTTCEFAIDSRSACRVYIGSPAEICATLYAYGTATLPTIDRLFCKDPTTIPLAKRLATSADPATFASLADAIGLSISERTARRILDGEIDDVDPILERITINGAEPRERAGNKQRKAPVDGRGLKLQREDVDALSSATKDCFAEIADKYYLEHDVQPKITVRRDRLTITIPIEKKP